MAKLSEFDKLQAKVLVTGAKVDEVALLDVFDKVEKRSVAMLCATQTQPNGDVDFLPLAVLIPKDVDRYARYAPPDSKHVNAYRGVK